MKKLFIFFALYTLCQFPACADQCAWIPQTVADNAYKILAHSKNYTDFCAPCADKEPVTRPINTLDIKPVYQKGTDEILYQILINNKPIDIAYIYINGKNLGMQANCTPINDVPEYIDDFLTGRWQLEETSL